MKATGIVRRIDDLGRVVLPKELRRTLEIAEGDPLEIFVNGKQVVIQKYAPGCQLCGSLADVRDVRGNRLCGSCISEIKKSN